MFPGANKKENRINTLNKNVIVDANILLDASFNLTGFSRSAIELLHEMDYRLLCDQNIYSEARNVLSKKKNSLQLNYDPLTFLNNLIKKFSFIFVNSDSNYSVRGINKNDQHVVRASIENDAFIITNDCPLYDECKKSGIPIRFSWHVQNEHSLRNRGKPIDPIQIHKPGKKKGFIFARLIPSSWDSSKGGNGIFTVVQLENLGKLFYASKTNKWCFETVGGDKVSKGHSFQSKDVVTLLVNYNNDGKNLLELRSCHDNHPDQQPLDKLSNADSVGRATFGHDINNQNHLNGILSTVIIGHKNIGKDNYNLFCKYKEAIPNPWDKGMLDSHLQKSDVQKMGEQELLIYFKPNN